MRAVFYKNEGWTQKKAFSWLIDSKMIPTAITTHKNEIHCHFDTRYVGDQIRDYYDPILGVSWTVDLTGEDRRCTVCNFLLQKSVDHGYENSKCEDHLEY